MIVGVRVPAGASGEESSAELMFCAECYSVSVPHEYTLNPTKSECAYCADQA